MIGRTSGLPHQVLDGAVTHIDGQRDRTHGNGIGRIGAILGPLIAGALLAAQYPMQSLFMLGAIAPACACVACFTMGRNYTK